MGNTKSDRIGVWIGSKYSWVSFWVAWQVALLLGDEEC